MKTVTAFVGSARKKGTTSAAARQLLDDLLVGHLEEHVQQLKSLGAS